MGGPVTRQQEVRGPTGRRHFSALQPAMPNSSTSAKASSFEAGSSCSGQGLRS